MNEPSDFQTTCSISRFLFETAVDMTLIICDPSNYPISKIIDWEQSAKLKYATENYEYYIKNPQKTTDKFWKEYPKFSDNMIKFIKNDGPAIKLKRMTPNRHEARWSVGGLDLATDKADKIAYHEFKQYYLLRHAPLC